MTYQQIKQSRVVLLNDYDVEGWLIEHSDMGHHCVAVKGDAPIGLLDSDGNQEDQVDIQWIDTVTTETIYCIYGYAEED